MNFRGAAALPLSGPRPILKERRPSSSLSTTVITRRHDDDISSSDEEEAQQQQQHRRPERCSVAFSDVAVDLETGERVPPTSRSRAEFVADAEQQRSARMIALFRALHDDDNGRLAAELGGGDNDDDDDEEEEEEAEEEEIDGDSSSDSSDDDDDDDDDDEEEEEGEEWGEWRGRREFEHDRIVVDNDSRNFDGPNDEEGDEFEVVFEAEETSDEGQGDESADDDGSPDDESDEDGDDDENIVSNREQGSCKLDWGFRELQSLVASERREPVSA
ncbi:hypothetical protein GGR52DRAFT_232620 [Hypoxylon sp. FL1284]|nr:hypothetical protein GGR52DRAFT_232620 [Hypoxylon sp. FL1284]